MSEAQPGVRIDTVYLPGQTRERALRTLPLSIGDRLGAETVQALYALVDGEVPPDLIADSGEGAAGQPFVPEHRPVELAVQRSISQAISAEPPRNPPFQALRPRQPPSSVDLITITRASDGTVSTSAVSGVRAHRREEGRPMTRAKADLALVALRASATGEFAKTTEESTVDGLAGHWVTRATMEAILAKDDHQLWLYIDGSALTITGRSIPRQPITFEELLLLYRLAGTTRRQRAHDLAGPHQSTIDAGAVFASASARLVVPGEGRMLFKSRSGTTGGQGGRPTHRRYRMAREVIISDALLEKALATTI